MSAGLPLFIISVLATIILIAWVLGGAGRKSKRVVIFSIVMLLLFASWAALLFFGVFHPVGSWGMLFGFIVSFAAFFVPMLFNRFNANENI